MSAAEMIITDENNVVLVETVDSVDGLNANFYTRFPYPWSPVKFEYLHDPDFQTVMLNQDVGAWQHDRVSFQPDIWVAGCGTNQAAFTALKFPRAKVIGSDVSPGSLKICEQNARQLGIANLELRRESLNSITYEDQFDYVICTGVIHHNADPRATLANLARAMKPTGVMELMVYNRFHWIIPIAFQHAIRILNGDTKTAKFETEARLVERFYGELSTETLMGSYISQFKSSEESRMADNLLQPVMYSYTVESLEEMADSCGLELVAPCLNQIDTSLGRLSWNMQFSDPVLREKYEALPDSRRWQITNLLLLNSSPSLWFYLQHKNGQSRKSEKQLCEEFLDTRFVKVGTTQRNYMQNGDGTYHLSPHTIQYPIGQPDTSVQKIYEAVDGHTFMRDIFQRLGIETTVQTVNRARLLLTTSAYPYLKAVQTVRSERSEVSGVKVDDGVRRGHQELNRKKFEAIKPKAFKISRDDI